MSTNIDEADANQTVDQEDAGGGGVSSGRPAPATSVPEYDMINNLCAADGYRVFLKNQDSSGNSDLQDLERQLEQVVDTLWQSAVIVENFSDQSQEKIFHTNIRKYMNHLSSISKIASKIDVEIPVRVLAKIDSGGNPDLVTKELAEICSAKNDATRGRIFATRVFGDIFKAAIDAWEQNVPLDLD